MPNAVTPAVTILTRYFPNSQKRASRVPERALLPRRVKTQVALRTVPAKVGIMTRPVAFGLNVDPNTGGLAIAARITAIADATGLGYAGVQDHPYNPDFESGGRDLAARWGDDAEAAA